MSWINKRIIYDFLIISLISVFLLTLVNFFFVYYSPILIKILPSQVTRSISPCYRTLFHHDQESLEKTNFVFGDSHSEGMGDEFLDGDNEYGIFNKLQNISTSELIFGRSGYGNIGTSVEFEQCYSLLSTYTKLDTSVIDKYDVTLVFYEGNDLNNNLVEINSDVNKLKYNLRFFFPIYDFAYRENIRVAKILYRRLMNTTIKSASNKPMLYPVTTSGIQLDRYPQSAATELSSIELDKSLSILFLALENIKRVLPEAESFTILYLPSVVSSYLFEGEIRVKSYSDDSEYFTTDKEFNSNRHDLILDLIKSEAQTAGWYVCNTTPNILKYTNNGIAVHGPRDWKHFNKAGYTLIVQAYKDCLGSM